MPPVERRFIDQPGIATMLGIDRRTLRRAIITRRFPPADLVLSKTCLRWKLSTVEAWIEENSKGEEGRR